MSTLTIRRTFDVALTKQTIWCENVFDSTLFFPFNITISVVAQIISCALIVLFLIYGFLQFRVYFAQNIDATSFELRIFSFNTCFFRGFLKSFTVQNRPWAIQCPKTSKQVSLSAFLWPSAVSNWLRANLHLISLNIVERWYLRFA